MANRNETTIEDALRNVRTTCDAFLAAIETAATAARAERTRLADEMSRLRSETAELRAEHSKACNELTITRAQSLGEFMKRCADAGIDKLAIGEIRTKVAEITGKKE